MERIAIPNVLVIAASLSLWSVAFQVAVDGVFSDGGTPSPQTLIARAEASADFEAPVLASHSETARAGLAGERLLEDGTPIVAAAAAAGRWF
jgi:hypothetical protein